MCRDSFIDIIELEYSALRLEVSDVSYFALSCVWNEHLLTCGWIDVQLILRFFAPAGLLLYGSLQSFLKSGVNFDSTGSWEGAS